MEILSSYLNREGPFNLVQPVLNLGTKSTAKSWDQTVLIFTSSRGPPQGLVEPTRKADTQKSRRFSNYRQGLRAGSDLREEQTPRSQDAFQITSKVRGQKATYARGRHLEVKTPFNLPAGSESRK